jgi:excisionase family DNA binding protein
MTTLAERLAAYERPMTVEELCAELSINNETVYDWIKAKRLPAPFKVGKSWRFEPRDILDWWLKRKAGC